jgi:hypothetical protein
MEAMDTLKPEGRKGVGCLLALFVTTQEFGSEYLVRVFVDIDRTPAEVVTAYRTGKVFKYWRAEV